MSPLLQVLQWACTQRYVREQQFRGVGGVGGTFWEKVLIMFVPFLVKDKKNKTVFSFKKMFVCFFYIGTMIKHKTIHLQ